MTTFLDGELVSFALCWRIERRDGVALGLTAHDRDLVVDSFRYRSAPGITPSALDAGDPLKAEALEIAGALTSFAISEKDLLAGRWDGAAVWLYAVDWSDPSNRQQLARGELGTIGTERGGFTAELRGPGAKLDRPVAEETSPMCRARLGDRRCRVDLSGRRSMSRIVSADDDLATIETGEAGANQWGGGLLRWLDGSNAGLTSFVQSSSGALLVLNEASPFAPQPGDRVELLEGCDKRFATCRDRFGNAANFRGEPHLPGVDLLTRYPGE